MDVLSKIKNIGNYLGSGSLTLNLGGFKVSIPALNIFGMNGHTITIGQYYTSPNSLINAVTTGARGVFCIGSVLTDPVQALNTLKMAGEFIEMLGIQVINDIYKVCLREVNSILSEVYGIVLGYFKTIKSVIQMVTSVGELLNTAYNKKLEFGKGALDELFDRKNCDYVVANILRCMINKMLKPYIQKIENKITQEITDISSDIKKSIIENTEGVTAMSDYINQQAQFVDKYATQLNMLIS